MSYSGLFKDVVKGLCVVCMVVCLIYFQLKVVYFCLS